MVIADPILSLSASIITITGLLGNGMSWLLAFGLDFEDLSLTAGIIQEILTRANEEHLPVTQNWLLDFQDAFCDVEDLRDSGGANSSLFSLRARFKIKKMKERFHDIRKRAQFIRTVLNDEGAGTPGGLRSTASQRDIHTVSGRDEDKAAIISMLLGERGGDSRLGITRIIGMAGVGKTTLAQIAYNDSTVECGFEIRAWVCVNQDFDHSRILREMMSTDPAGMISARAQYSSQNRMYEDFTRFIGGKKVLLVLDDVRAANNEDWKKLLSLLKTGAAGGSRVLVTTQRDDVCRAMEMEEMVIQETHILRPLNDSESWDLFLKIAFPHSNEKKCPHEIESFAREIVDKCKGLPSAVKAMGSFLQSSLDRRSWRKISKLDISEAERVFCRSRSEFKQLNILTTLKVSYNQLPSYIKPLFACCSMFPKGCSINKKELAQLWMAESLIESHGQETMEEIASECFDHLLKRSFFQMMTSDHDHDHYYYMMHDLYHELARSISTPYCYQVEGGSSSSIHHFPHKTRHISIAGGHDHVQGHHVFHVENLLLQIMNDCKKLRTLLFPNHELKTEFGRSLDKLFSSMKYMRVLDLSSSTILKLPKSIKRLKLLRYLNLSKTNIRALPHSISKLFYLQTLKLLECPHFSKLPQNLAKLINLRHLELDEALWLRQDFKLPPRMGRLTNLHTLRRFPISRRVGHGIEELKGMLYLTGLLIISNLENAVNAGEAELYTKEMVHKLVLEWSSNINSATSVGQGDDGAEVVEKVLEDLRPHSDLKELQILHFRGTRFPLWVTDGQLQNLVTLSLEHCPKCTTLSLQGELPNLKKLYIKQMEKLEQIQESEIYINSLVSLEISVCPRLTMLPSRFPNLEDLNIRGCNSLMALPVTPSLKVLVLVDNLVLDDLNGGDGSNLSSLSELKINGCPKVKALPRTITPKKVELSGRNLLQLFPVGAYSQLEHLVLDECKDKILDLVMGAIPEITCLESLVISNITMISSFPRWPRLPGLKALYIRNCKGLTSLVSFRILKSLQLLSIQDCPQLTTLSGNGLPTTLECLTLRRCPELESLGLGDVLQSTSLRDLHIEQCPKLHSLPDQGVPISLQHLVIRGCPVLEERCRGEEGLDWPKITHVPQREIDSSPSSSSLHSVEAHSIPSSSTPPITTRRGESFEGTIELSNLGRNGRTFDNGTSGPSKLAEHELFTSYSV